MLLGSQAAPVSHVLGNMLPKHTLAIAWVNFKQKVTGVGQNLENAACICSFFDFW
jgi:hypothetical protein